MTSSVITSVAQSSDGVRIDAFLAGLSGIPSRSAAAKLVEAGSVLINGVATLSKSTVVHTGNKIEVELPPVIETPPTLEPEAIPLDIRYEDEYLLVISKQRGLVCHPSAGHEYHTLAHALVAHCGPDHLGRMQGDDRPGIVHRLDMDTTGLMLAAKDDTTQAALQEAIRVRKVDRRYVTLVHGVIAPDTGLIDAPISRSTRDRLKMMVSSGDNARASVTTFNTLERFEAGKRDDGYTLLECKLFTGRTHQIRVHMASIGHHVVGDPMYGRGDDDVNLHLDRQFLHSWRLTFEHPVTKQPFTFIDELTWELQEALFLIEDKSTGCTKRGEEVFKELGSARLMRESGW
ncbi:MAG: RluA family pseudouridine synthase [Coriobacteriales bacterium]|nr:RluA family pseudouridine synthase [Coriobacteriales bacterium]